MQLNPTTADILDSLDFSCEGMRPTEKRTVLRRDARHGARLRRRGGRGARCAGCHHRHPPGHPPGIAGGSMSPKDKAARDVARALELAAASEHEDIRKRPHAFLVGALEVDLTEAYRQLDLAERRLAEAQRTLEALHEFHGHGDVVDAVEEGLPPHHVVVRELDQTYTVRGRADEVVFSGSEAELLVWARAQSEAT